MLISIVKPSGDAGALITNTSSPAQVFWTVFLKTIVPAAVVTPPGGTLAMPVSMLRLLKSSFTPVGPIAPGTPPGPIRTSPILSGRSSASTAPFAVMLTEIIVRHRDIKERIRLILSKFFISYFLGGWMHGVGRRQEPRVSKSSVSILMSLDQRIIV